MDASAAELERQLVVLTVLCPWERLVLSCLVLGVWVPAGRVTHFRYPSRRTMRSVSSMGALVVHCTQLLPRAHRGM